MQCVPVTLRFLVFEIGDCTSLSNVAGCYRYELSSSSPFGFISLSRASVLHLRAFASLPDQAASGKTATRPDQTRTDGQKASAVPTHANFLSFTFLYIHNIIKPAISFLIPALQHLHSSSIPPPLYPFRITQSCPLCPLPSPPILSSASNITTELPLITTIPNGTFSPPSFSSTASSRTMFRKTS